MARLVEMLTDCTTQDPRISVPVRKHNKCPPVSFSRAKGELSGVVWQASNDLASSARSGSWRKLTQQKVIATTFPILLARQASCVDHAKNVSSRGETAQLWIRTKVLRELSDRSGSMGDKRKC